MKLLIIEDDRETAAYLAKGLAESGYSVEQANNGRDGLFLASSGMEDSPELERRLMPQVVQSLIDERLKLQEAKRLKITVNDAAHRAPWRRYNEPRQSGRVSGFRSVELGAA